MRVLCADSALINAPFKKNKTGSRKYCGTCSSAFRPLHLITAHEGDQQNKFERKLSEVLLVEGKKRRRHARLHVLRARML